MEQQKRAPLLQEVEEDIAKGMTRPTDELIMNC
jgi:hypothetical protein